MTPERWRHVKEIFDAALERKESERAAFLSVACAGDEQLKAEIESLLAADASEMSFLESPAVHLSLPDITPIQFVNQQFAHFQIIRQIGTGGMGEVYIARDRKLGRRVAIKILNEKFEKHEANLNRFIQEAKAASALNHPNILVIHEIGETDTAHYIVSEYIEGKTLREIPKEKTLKLTEILDIAIQIANALTAAHAAKIVHRDIKPENIMIRPDGLLKVLDFGLAKLVERKNKSLPGLEDETAKQNETAEGVILGTIAYMSPEQAKGERVDERTDIFSFGVLIYELIAGRTPFAGDSMPETFANLINTEPPPLARFAADVPNELQRIVSKMLRKNRDERYQTMKGLLADLKELKENLSFAEKLERSASPEEIAGAETAIIAERQAAKHTGQPRGPLAAQRGVIYAAVLITLLLGAFAFVWRWRQTSVAPPQPEIKSLAVLPLESLDASENYLGLGIADAVIRRISQTGELTVRPTSAVRRYLAKDTDALAAARELNADAVLEGSVQRAEDRLRVSVNLLRTGDGKSLWSESFDMRSADIFTIQDTVAQQVVARLRLHLNPTQQMRLAKRHTSNTIAYEYYLKGMYSLDQRGWSIEGKPQMEATIALFKQAIGADPQYALAHAQLAFAYAWMANFIELDPVWVEYARQEIRQAEALDSQLAETHVARHLILWSAYEGFQNEAAIRELLLAQQLNPSIGNLELGVLYWHIGLEDQADRALQRALEIDPTSEKVKEEFYNSTILSGRIDEGLAAQQRFFNRGPDLKYYLEKNRLNHAQPLLEQALEKDPDNPAVRLRKALFLALKKDFRAAEAEIPWILEHIRKDRGYHHIAYEIARVYALAGKSQEAVKWLRETAGTGKPCYPLFERDPYLNRIRQAPEFIQFMTEMKEQHERYRREFE